MAEQEGVIKYQLDWEKTQAIAPFDFASLDKWHRRFKDAGILGVDSDRYDGYGFGNISERLNQHSFLISGTQTGHLDVLTPNDYAIVVRCIIEENRVVAQGPVKPSSEALTHAAIYSMSEDIRFVFHVHSPDIWRNREGLGLPETARDVPYGTALMATEIARLHGQGAFDEMPLLAMAGHEDGVIGFGATADDTGELLMSVLAKLNKILIVPCDRP